MLVNVRNFLISQAFRLYYSDTARRAAHTFVQAFLAVWLVTGFKLDKATLVAAVAAGISAVKSYLVSKYGSEA